MLTPAFFRDYRVVPSRRWYAAARMVFALMERVTGTRLGAEDVPHLDRPVMFATNSTQKYDFLAFRRVADRARLPAVTVTKGKNYHDPAMALAMGRLGVVPLASRGYLILVDFERVHRRRASDDEYRALRRHIDEDVPLPETAALLALRTLPRTILGHELVPTRESYAQVMRRVYVACMGETLRLMREAVAAGHHVQMYPEGTVSPRLGVGRHGAVQFAAALGLPIVPVGMSGCPEAFRGQGMALRGGSIRVRFGAPLPAPVLPADFVAFAPASEARHRAALARHTGAVMDAIDALLDPAYRRPAGAANAPAGPTDTRKFL